MGQVAQLCRNLEANIRATQKVHHQRTPYLYALLFVSLCTLIGCPGTPPPDPGVYTLPPDVSLQSKTVSEVATGLHSDAASIKTNTNVVRTAPTTSPHTAAAQTKEALNQIDTAAIRVDKAAEVLEIKVVPPLDEAAIRIASITKERDEANARTAAEKKAKEAAQLREKKAIESKNSLTHVMLTGMTALGVAGVVFFGVMLVIGGPTTDEAIGMGGCFVLVIVSSVVNVYYEQLALYGLIAIVTAVLGAGLFLALRLYRSKQVNVQSNQEFTDIVQFVENLKGDLKKAAPEIAQKWFGDDYVRGQVQVQLNESPLIKKVREVRASGKVKLAK